MRAKATLVLFALLALSAPACNGCRGDQGAPDAAPQTESEAPPPDGLLAEASLLDPNSAWSRVQRGVGGAVALLPMTLGGLVCTLGGIDPVLAQEIDGTQPAYAVVAKSKGANDGGASGGGLSFAVAVRLVEPRRARIALVDADNARYKVRDEAGFSFLVSKGLPLSASAALTQSGWLLVASDDASLKNLGPYAYRTLPARPKRKSSLTVVASHTALLAVTEDVLLPQWRAWKKEMQDADAQMRAAHGGRAPDFGDPAAILETAEKEVSEKADVLRDLDRAELSLDVNDDAFRATLSLVAGASNGASSHAIAEMRPGDPAPLLDTPADATLALLARSDAASRAASSQQVEDALVKTLGDRVSPAERQDLHATLASWASGRGDWLTASVFMGKPNGVVVTAPKTDADSCVHSAHKAAELLGRPAFRGPFEAAVDARGVALGNAEPPHGVPLAGAKLELLSIARRDPKEAHLGAAWADVGSKGPGDAGTSGAFVFAAGDDPAALFAAGAAPAHTMKDDARVAGIVNAFGPDVAFVLVARSALLGLAGAATGNAPPLVVAWGKRKGDASLDAGGGASDTAWLEVDLGAPLVREIVRRSGGF